ncbi:MAG: hypothetical protein JRH20_28935 [Deltaproteobacteria bacterium]|nr:hypothetical protein [Deltaproteobacteria bacterium]
MLFCRLSHFSTSLLALALALALASSACSDNDRAPYTGWLVDYTIDGPLEAGASGTDGALDGGALDGAALDGAALDHSPGEDRPTDGAPAADVLSGCVFDPGPADRERVAVVSRPYAEDFTQAGDYEVIHISSAGVLSRPNIVFTMTRTFSGEIIFSADGRFGYVAQEDGSIGVFRVEADRSVVVLDATFDPGFHVSRLVMGPGGRRLFALNSQWRVHGGGIYQLAMECDGTLTNLGLLAASKIPFAMGFLSDSLAVVAARDILDSPAGHDVHLVSLAPTPTVTPSTSLITSASVFDDDESAIADVAITADQRYALLPDIVFKGDDRLAVVDLGKGGTTAPSVVQVLAYEDPSKVIMSPFNNAALLLGVAADRLTVLNYTPSNPEPFTERGKVKTSSSTLLPDEAVMIRRGSLAGHVFVAENVTIRRLRFFPDGRVEEVDAFSFGTGGRAVVGAMGVQP